MSRCGTGSRRPHAALLAPPAAIVRRLRQIGGLLLLPEATPMQRVAMVGWLGQAPAGNTLRMLVTAPAAWPLAGEQVLTLPGAQAAPQVRAGSRRRWRQRRSGIDDAGRKVHPPQLSKMTGDSIAIPV